MSKSFRTFQEESKQEEYENQEITLTNQAVNPFDTWSDWYGENGEAVVTFITMKQHLYENWSQQAVTTNATNYSTVNGRPTNEDDYIRIFDHERFENDFDGPGIYRDGTYYRDDNKVDESYTIIVPNEYMTEKLCRNWIAKLNEQYNRKFKLEEDDYENRELEWEAQNIKSNIEENREYQVGLGTIKQVLRHKEW